MLLFKRDVCFVFALRAGLGGAWVDCELDFIGQFFVIV